MLNLDDEINITMLKNVKYEEEDKPETKKKNKGKGKAKSEKKAKQPKPQYTKQPPIRFKGDTEPKYFKYIQTMQYPYDNLGYTFIDVYGNSGIMLQWLYELRHNPSDKFIYNNINNQYDKLAKDHYLEHVTIVNMPVNEVTTLSDTFSNIVYIINTRDEHDAYVYKFMHDDPNIILLCDSKHCDYVHTYNIIKNIWKDENADDDDETTSTISETDLTYVNPTSYIYTNLH